MRTSAGRSRRSPRGGGTGEPPWAADSRVRQPLERPASRAGWSGCRPGWIRAWRAGEWDSQALLFTGDLGIAADRGLAVPDAGMPDGDAPHVGALRWLPPRPASPRGTGWAEFDAAPPPRVTRPLQRGACAVPGCEGELHCNGLCFRHERCWRKDASEPAEAFIARARPLSRAADCQVPGCDRESVSRRGLCRFHDQRLLRARKIVTMTGNELAAWIARERPRLGVHQFSLAGLPELLRAELLYALQQRDQAPPPLDPTLVRMLLARLGDAASLRAAEPAGRLRVRRRAVQPGGSRTVPGPAPPSGPGPGPVFRHRPVRRRRLAGCAAGAACQRLPALAGHPGSDRPADHRAGLAARDRPGLGPLYPALPAAAARDGACLPGCLARPDHRQPRPGGPGRRGLHPHPGCDQRPAARQRSLVLSVAPQPDDLPVLPGHRARAGQRADERGA